MNYNRNEYIKNEYITIPKYINLNRESETNLNIDIDYCMLDVFKMGDKNIFQNKIDFFLSKISDLLMYSILLIMLIIIIVIIMSIASLLHYEIIDGSIQKIILQSLRKNYVLIPLIVSLLIKGIVYLKAPQKIYLNISDTGINITSNLIERGNVFIEKTNIEDIVIKTFYYKNVPSFYDITLKCINPLLLEQSKRKIKEVTLISNIGTSKECVDYIKEEIKNTLNLNS